MSVSIHDSLFKQLPSPGHCREGGLRRSRSMKPMYLVSNLLNRFKKFKLERENGGILTSFFSGILDSSNFNPVPIFIKSPASGFSDQMPVRGVRVTKGASYTRPL